jgi:hypothetical protein
MASLLFRLKELVRDSLPGSAVAIAMGAALLLGLALVVAMVRRRHSPWLLFGVLAGEAALFGAAACAIELAQHDLFVLVVLRTFDLDPSQRARMVAEALSQIVETQYFASRVSVVVLALAAVALWRERPRHWWHRFLWLGLSLAAITLGTILVRDQGWHFGSSCPEYALEPNCKTRLLWEALLEGARVIRIGKGALWAVGAMATLGLGWLSIRDTKRGLVASRRAVLGTSALLGLGALATVSTRAKAFDGAHPLPPLWDGDDQCSLAKTDVAALPRGPRDCATIDGPVVEIQGARVTVDGITMANPSELEQTLSNKRNLWHQINPFGKNGYRTVRVAAAREKAMGDVWPWIESARRAGFDQIAVVYKVEPPTVAHTATAGELSRVRCCDAVWQASAFPGKTWEELAAAAVPLRQ